MEIRQLEYFCMISELENFTKTAQMLHVSQPSVTKAIKSLESEFQLTLINRSQKHISLTEEGRVFLLHAKKILQEVEAAKHEMQEFHDHTKGIIHVGIPPIVEGYLFPDFFTKFRQIYPEINLDVKEHNDSQEVRERAEQGDLDFGIVMGKTKEKTLNSFSIMADRMDVCFSLDHSFKEKTFVEFSDLKGEKFIMQQPATYQYQQVFSRCNDAGFVPDVLLCTSQIKTIKQLVANGMGISVLPNFVTRNERKMLHCALRPSLKVGIYLYWGKHKIFSRIDKKFIDFMKKYTTSLEFRQHFRQE